MTRTHGTRTALFLLTGLALAACGEQQKADGNSDSGGKLMMRVCPSPPTLALANGAQLASQPMEETKAHFRVAYETACAKGLLKDEPLIDPKASDPGKLFLINAPEANVASIYVSEVDGNRMMLEYPFLTTDGKTQVPSADELEEAIYCAVHGATQDEQEKTGRCMVD
jgi:hypothetical protein